MDWDISIHICLAAQFTLDAPSDRKASAIYIDTEGSFVIERVASMATHFIEDFVATSTRPRMVQGCSAVRSEPSQCLIILAFVGARRSASWHHVLSSARLRGATRGAAIIASAATSAYRGSSFCLVNVSGLIIIVCVGSVQGRGR